MSSSSAAPIASRALLVDAHVHLHAGFDPAAFLAGAARNFAAGARSLGLPLDAPGCLLLADPAGAAPSLARLDDARTRLASEGWSLEAATDGGAAVARGPKGRWLRLVAGRQLATRERLEVLALATGDALSDGLSLDETLAAVRASGALAVLPWGFGKWWLGRGVRVRARLRTCGPGEIFLGDNGGRPPGREPALFELARERGIAILPGSDPLPLPWEQAVAGSYGFALPGAMDPSEPVRALAERIRTGAHGIVHFGGRRGLAAFARSQVAIRVRGANARP